MCRVTCHVLYWQACEIRIIGLGLGLGLGLQACACKIRNAGLATVYRVVLVDYMIVGSRFTRLGLGLGCTGLGLGCTGLGLGLGSGLGLGLTETESSALRQIPATWLKEKRRNEGEIFSKQDSLLVLMLLVQG